MISKDYLMLKSGQRARLEARTASLQLFFTASQFLTASFAGKTWMMATLLSDRVRT